MTIAALILGATLLAPADTVVVTADHYRVYDGEGNPSSFEAVIEAARAVDVVLVGEEHTDPVGHYIEYRLLIDLFDVHRERGVALSMEMFTRDVQHVVDEYLADLITTRHFESESRPWPNYGVDYRRLVEFAKDHGIDVVAANAPRRYVNRVTRGGRQALEELPEYARAWLPPLPYAEASDAYRRDFIRVMQESLEEMESQSDSTRAAREDDPVPYVAAVENPHDGDHGYRHGERYLEVHGEDAGNPHQATPPAHRQGDEQEGHQAMPPAHRQGDAKDEDAPAVPQTMPPGGMASAMHSGMGTMLDAQSLWDAAMAYSIAESLLENPGQFLVHMVGAFHVENGTGIPEHLARYAPYARQLIVTVRPVEDISEFDREEFAGLADFVILADESLPRTHER